MVTSMPSLLRFSASSRLIKPPPARMAERGVVPGDIFFDAEGIFHCAQCENMLQIDAGETGKRWFRSRGEKQFIIAFLKDFSCLQILYTNGLPVRMKGGHFVMYLHVDPEPDEKTFRRLQGQGFGILDDSANIIRQAAVCV